MERFWQDLRFGLRLLLKKPGFTVIAVLSLALGIGANSAIFSLVDVVLLKQLPFREPDRLVVVWEEAARIGFPRNTPAPGNYADWKAQNQVFEDMAAVTWRSFNLTGDGEPERIPGQAVTANFFQLLGVAPQHGRSFLQEEDQPGGNKVVLVSHGLWQTRFGGDPGTVGTNILLDGQKHTVVGIMPPGFQFLGREIGLWVPVAFSKEALADRGSHYLTVLARMKPDATLAQAQADVAVISRRISRNFPREAFKLGSVLISLREQLAGEVRPALLVLLVAVGFVLLIACANIANLLLSRGAVRYKEIAVRSALGAGRWHIVRQLLTESVLLAVVGGLAGLLFARASFSFLTQLVPDGISLTAQLRMDVKVFGFTLLLSLLTGILFGMAPALQAAKVDLNEALKLGGGRTGSGLGHRRLRNVLVVAEVSLALVLLTGSALLIKTFLHLRSMNIGLRPDNVLTVRTMLARNKYVELPKRAAFYEQVLERVRSLPGVVGSGYTTAVPLTWKGGTNGFWIEGREQLPGQDANHRQVSSGYMETMGMTLQRGRFFNQHDSSTSQPVVIINATMARQYWQGESALGKHLRIGGNESQNPWHTIVGVVEDVKQMGLEAPGKAEMYFPYSQMADSFWAAPRDLTIRTSGDPMQIAAAVRQAIWSVDRDQPVSNIRTMKDILGEEVIQRRIGMTLLGTFAALALLLASIGIYGVLSWVVAQRTQEIGIHMALGAQRQHVFRMVVGDGMRLAVTGVVIGLAASYGLTRLMSSLLFGVSASDPMTFASVPMILLIVALAACSAPARRAIRTDPMVALRYE
jgi:putative ABC transport system permease protein